MQIKIIFFIILLLVLCNAGCEYQLIEKNGECVHKNLFDSFSLYDGLSIALIFILCLLGSVGGTAGGIFIVPIYLLILNFDAQDAISCSICIVGITQILKMGLAIKMRHPFRNRPIIDYSFAAITAPAVFLGNIFGIILNMWLSNLIIKIMFLLLIVQSFWNQTKKGIQVWKKEQQTLKCSSNFQSDDTKQLKQNAIIIKGKNKIDAEIQTNFSYLYQKYKAENQIIDNNIEIQDDTEFSSGELKPEIIPEKIQQQYNKYCHRESQTVYWYRLIPISIAFLLVSLVSVFKGSSKFDSIVGIETCSSLYWILTFITVPFIILIILIIMRQYIKENYIKQQVNCTSVLEEIEWNYYNVQKYCILGIIVGYVQSFLGLGGLIIWSPILLSQKIPADVVVFTLQFLAMLGALNNFIQLILMGNIIWDYVGMTSLAAGIAFILGLKIVLQIINKLSTKILPYFQRKKKRSLIILSLSVIEIGSFVVVLINSIVQAKKANDKGKNIWAMKNFCD